MSEPAPADAFDVVVVGSLNLDLVVRAPRLPGPGETVSSSGYQEFPGGKGLNQAVAAARAGASVAFVGAIGDDDAGGRLRHVVRDEGIDERWLVTVILSALMDDLINISRRGNQFTPPIQSPHRRNRFYG